MAGSAAGKIVSALVALRNTTGRFTLGYTPACTFLQARNYAARKGTREKARKKKVKVEVKKVAFIPHNQRGIASTPLPIEKLRFDDSSKSDPVDDVYIGLFYKTKIYPLAEAIQYHKETHCPAMMDAPDAFIKAMIELDMKGHRPSRPVTKFARLVTAPHTYDHGENRSVLVFCKTPELQEEAKKAGATLVGGPELISAVQLGEVNLADVEYVVAHPNIMAEILLLKGLLKRKYPTPSAGSLGADVSGMVKKFLHGIRYSGNPHERQPLFGTGEFVFGRLNMDTQALEENFAAVINDINAHRPKRPGPFIIRIRIASPPSKECFTINHELYDKSINAGSADDDDEDDDDDVPAAATAV